MISVAIEIFPWKRKGVLIGFFIAFEDLKRACCLEASSYLRKNVPLLVDICYCYKQMLGLDLFNKFDVENNKKESSAYKKLCFVC